MEGFWVNLVQINLVLQQLGEWLFIPMRFFSFLVDEKFYLFVMPAIFWCYDSRLGLQVGLLLMFSNGVNSIFKFIFHSPRPFWVSNQVNALVKETSFGIPSGHSQNAAVMWGFFASASKKVWLRVVFGLIIFFIGFSRLYLGVHFVTDVLLGWAIGLILLWIYLLIFRRLSANLSNWSTAKKWIGITITTLLIIFIPLIFKMINSSYQISETFKLNIGLAYGGEVIDPYALDGVITAGGAWFGLLTGIFATYRLIPIGRIRASWQQLIIRFIIGVTGVLILWGGLKMIFPEDIQFLSEILRFIRYGLIGFWIAGGAPWLFKKIGLELTGENK